MLAKGFNQHTGRSMGPQVSMNTGSGLNEQQIARPLFSAARIDQVSNRGWAFSGFRALPTRHGSSRRTMRRSRYAGSARSPTRTVPTLELTFLTFPNQKLLEINNKSVRGFFVIYFRRPPLKWRGGFHGRQTVSTRRYRQGLSYVSRSACNSPCRRICPDGFCGRDYCLLQNAQRTDWLNFTSHRNPYCLQRGNTRPADE